jgi:hypothetical protein
MDRTQQTFNTTSDEYQFPPVYRIIDSLNFTLYSGVSGITVSRIIPSSFNLFFIFLSCFVFLILTWYFDYVIPDENGKKSPLHFFIFPSFWGYILFFFLFFFLKF